MGKTSIEWTETGRSVASTGYVLIRVGVGHPLADVRGYAYEHRLVASVKLGRWVTRGEIVHHADGCKTNNAPDNLEVVIGNAEHFSRHRTRCDLRAVGEPNPLIVCACGCGTTFARFDTLGRPRAVVTGHNARRATDGRFARAG